MAGVKTGFEFVCRPDCATKIVSARAGSKPHRRKRVLESDQTGMRTMTTPRAAIDKLDSPAAKKIHAQGGAGFQPAQSGRIADPCVCDRTAISLFTALLTLFTSGLRGADLLPPG